jgi:CheY-like chemotaxis protein
MEQGLTVLHVDDDPSFLGLTSRLFEREAEGVEAVTAATTEEAFERIERERVDCVVSDSIRTEDGEPFVAAVRRQHPETPVVLFTGTEWEELDPDAVEAGVASYVQKGGSTPLSSLAARIRTIAGMGKDGDESAARMDDRPGTGEGSQTVREDGSGSAGAAGSAPDWIDPGSGWVVLAIHDWASTDELVVTVVDAVERVVGSEGSGSPLYEVVNGEALEELLRPTGDGGETVVRFSYRGLDVAVAQNGEVAVRRPDAGGDMDGDETADGRGTTVEREGTERDQDRSDRSNRSDRSAPSGSSSYSDDTR